MKNRLIPIILLIGLGIISACSSTSEEKPGPQGATTAGPGSTNTNGAIVANGVEIAPPRTADANASTATSTDPVAPPGALTQDRLDGLRKSGESGPGMDAATLARKNAKPAPDNSTFTSYLTDAGYEIRTFNNHPQLLKVEKKITSDGNQTLKVFLRNGKVIDLPGQKINPLASAPASLILTAAEALPPPPVQRPPDGTAPGKKPNQ